jgi:Fe-Mn family superoxide dismutase
MFKQVELNYGFKDLEPYIDELTMITHYTKHHAAYTTNFNAAAEKAPQFAGLSAEEIFARLFEVEDASLRTALQNHGGGFYNHNLYFSTLSPNGGKAPTGEFADQIQKDFGSFEAMTEQLSTAAATRFGSGWAFLSANKDGQLKISSSSNQENPIMETKGEWTPIAAVDVWEHAYYLKYKNLRGDYIKALLQVIDWELVAKNWGCAKK